ncbi:hypothetical protein [Nocardia cyriacigeorgica]|uniref:hypothetical protein n=1 Tax=Nocardia cyriacigeorgica TaxID=135487 RepID=UPI0018956BAF|nr:hypothetical protein [Nocardia cyriacigeorgica]MBF6437880.1 hypothetical protein [Nocardia cyriacigeorgica]
MSSYPQLSQDSLAKLRDEFTKNFDELKAAPAKVNEGYDQLKKISLVHYYAGTHVRDDIQAKLAKAISELEKAVEGMFAPWLFVDYASKWQQVGNKVEHARGIANAEIYNLEGNWDGSAYKSFKESKNYQINAMAAVEDLCERVHDQLLIIAEEGRKLYSDIVKNIISIVTQVGIFLAESLGTGGAAVPFILSDLNSIVVGMVDLIVQAMVDFVETQAKVVIASNELSNMIEDRAEFVDPTTGKDAWPTPNSAEYDNKDDDWHMDGQDK